MDRKYITLAPSEDELNLIRALYERARGLAVMNGDKPPSFSRYLITSILRGEGVGNE
jgi:hypothetical protein